MAIYFNEKFKNLRKAHDLTQEQIADIFHVSPQAVSRWETGATYPDIEMLPHLAIFFKVTVDEFLGTKAILGEEKVKEYIRDIRNLLNSGKLHDAIDTARKAVKEYPVNDDLQFQLLQSLGTACSDDSRESEEDIEKFKKEIIAIGERIINSTKQNECLDHKFYLIRQYAKWKMKEEAKKIVYTLPSDAWHTQDLSLGYVLEGEEWLKHQKCQIVRFTIMLCGLIGLYSCKADLDTLQKIECTKAMLKIESLTYPIADEEGDYIWHAFENIGIAELYCEAGDVENALNYVEIATQDSMYHIERMYKTNEDGSNYFAWPSPRNLCWILWEDHLAKPQFDIIRNEERFTKCFEALKSNSRELKH